MLKSCLLHAASQWRRRRLMRGVMLSQKDVIDAY